MKKLWNRFKCFWRGFHRWRDFPDNDTCRDCSAKRSPLKDTNY